MKKQHIAIMVGLICFLLVISILIQMKTVKSMQTTVGTTFSKNSELIDEALTLQEEYNMLYHELEKAEAKLEIVRTQAASGNQEDKDMEQELKENNSLLGLSEVTGEGIIIKLDDNRNVEGDELNISQYLVHEQDLLHVINELYNAGAEAISVNDNRIVSSTSILCDGNIIRVNGKIITVPITIKAICSKAIKNTLNRPQGYLQIMANEGIDVKIIDENSTITIPKFDGVYNSTHLARGEE